MKLVLKPPGTSIVLLAGAAGLALGACGYPTFGFVSEGTSSGASGTGGLGGAGGMGGLGGGAPGTGGDPATSTVSVTSTASATSSGAGCMTTGLSTCTSTCGCLAKQKCAITDEAVGTMTCITAGPVPNGSKCNVNQDCGVSSFCDHKHKVCRAICDGVGDCPANAQCIPAKQAVDGTTNIPGLNLCTAHCNPSDPLSCGPNITCFYDFKTVEFDCASGPNTSENSVCVLATDCAKGLVCAGGMAGFTCAQWCTPINTMIKNLSCPGLRPYCDPVTVNVNYDGKDYGICSK